MPRYISFATMRPTMPEFCQSTSQSLYLSLSSAEKSDFLLSLVKKLGMMRSEVFDIIICAKSSVLLLSDRLKLAIRQIRITLFMVRIQFFSSSTCCERFSRLSSFSFSGMIASVIFSACRILSNAISIICSSYFFTL